jgi:hypothetical protein
LAKSSSPTPGFKSFLALLIGSGSLLLVAGLAPLFWLHLLLDPLSSDHHATPLDQPFFAALRLGMAGLGLLLILAGTTGLALPDRTRPVLHRLKKHAVDLWQDNRRLLAELVAARPTGWEAALLAVIACAGLFARLVLLPGPMQYDESMSFIDYASHSLWIALSSYDAPNNHVFHTLLMQISFRLFGDAPAVVRLPAFIAGMLIIPAAYLLGRTLYNRRVGWLAAALAAWWPQLVFYSANARGYSLLGLFSLLIFTLASRAVKQYRPAAWVWIALLSALGLFTIPVMAYSLGILYTWLLISLLTGETRPAYTPRRFVAWMVSCGAASLLLAGLFYLPVLFTSGLSSLLGNEFVRSLTWPEFIQSLPYFTRDILTRFTQAISLPVIFLLVLGLVLSLALHRRTARYKVPIFAATLLFFIIAIPVQRPELLAKLFYFNLPLLAVWIASGWTAAFMLLPRRFLATFIPSFVALTLVVSCVWQALPNLPYLNGAVESHEEVAAWLKANLAQDEIVLIDYPTDYRVYFYAHRIGLSLDSIRSPEKRSITRAFVVVNPREGQTLQSVIADKSLNWCPLDLSTAREQALIGYIYIYALDPTS